MNIYSKNITKVAEALKELDQASSKRLTEVTQMPRGSVTSALKALREEEVIHIGAWELNRTTMPTRIYKWGMGRDVKAPILISKTKISNPTNSKLPWPRADVAAAWLTNSI